MTEREWDFCDQCIFYISCLRSDRRKGVGCEVFEPYPYELPALELERCEVTVTELKP